MAKLLLFKGSSYGKSSTIPRRFLRWKFHYSKAVITVKVPLTKDSSYRESSTIRRQFLQWKFHYKKTTKKGRLQVKSHFPVSLATEIWDFLGILGTLYCPIDWWYTEWIKPVKSTTIHRWIGILSPKTMLSYTRGMSGLFNRWKSQTFLSLNLYI